MVALNKEKIKNFIQLIDSKIILISVVVSAFILYYINPLANVNLTEFNRTFSSSVMAGISIDKRISHFYTLFFLQIPIVLIVVTGLLNLLFQWRESYKKHFFELSAIMIFPTIISYISRYTSEGEFTPNLLMFVMLSFYAILAIVAILDKEKIFADKHITLLCVTYLIGIITCNILFNLSSMYIAIGIMAVLILGYVAVLTKTKIGQRIVDISFNYICFIAWIPAVMMAFQEFLYWLNEKGIYIQRHYTYAVIVVILYAISSFAIVFLARKKKLSFFLFGALGMIISLSCAKFLPHTYFMQYDYGFEMKNYSNFFETGNTTVAIDTIKYGKLPILSNFSAHALMDAWTEILYALIHSDIKGIIYNPYYGLNFVIGTILLFFIFKNIFGIEKALLLTCLFPIDILGAKAISVCLLPIVFLLNILRKKNIKNYLLFWLFTLIAAFTIYDEGISLGIACILAIAFVLAIQKDWKELIKFIGVGASVGVCALVLYVVYCLANGIAVIGRIKEWMALSLDSSSTWATAVFGDPSSFNFALVYFVIPIIAIVSLLYTAIKYMMGERQRQDLFSLIVVFALAQILYISRTIIFHNLAVAFARTGVLLNFVHWTISIFVLYLFVLKGEKDESRKMLIWISTYTAVVLIECVYIMKFVPTNSTVIFEGALESSQSIRFSNDMSDILGKERISYSKETTDFITQFNNVFDTLLKEDETFLDFSNITALYLLTDRDRPFYVAQSPSLLTNVYSQECLLEEISEYKVPLAILGTTTQSYIAQMMDIPHNIRYYTVAEYIYQNYRPLVKAGDFAIWCENERYDEYKDKLEKNAFFETGYTLLDYGYDFTYLQKDEKGHQVAATYQPYHQYDLKLIPNLWAEYDEDRAIENKVIRTLESEDYEYQFEGSQNINRENGNYIAFKVASQEEEERTGTVILMASNEEGAQFEYQYTVLPGEHEYLIRVSQDYFWEAFNIDTIWFLTADNTKVENVRVLEGD